MSTFAIFLAGTAVTLMVGTALALVVLAAVQDGKDEATRGTDEREHTPGEARAAARPVSLAGTERLSAAEPDSAALHGSRARRRRAR